MKNRSAGAANVVRITIFILLPVLLVVLMYFRIYEMLDLFFEQEIAANINYLGEMASQQISAKMDDIKNTAEYFRDGAVAEEDMETVMNRLLIDENRIGGGIVRLDGSPVSGKNILTSEYIGIQNTFRGKGVVTYREGEGFLFTAPIYNGANVKYALYEFFDPDFLFDGYSKNFYNGDGEMAIVDSFKQTVYPISENTDTEIFYDESMQSVYKEINEKMGADTTAVVFVSDKHGQNYFYVSRLDQSNLYLMGYVSFHSVGGRIVFMVLQIFLLYIILLAMLLTGTLSVVNANSKIRESEELRIAKQMAEESSRSKSEFLAKMTHELRTPINVILGMDEMILREDTSEDTRARAMDIRGAAQILLGLINDVLDFSKIESGNMNIIETEYNLPILLRDFALLTENRARQKSLHFDIKTQPDLPVGLYGDDLHLRQIVTNLLTNAVKYTPEGNITLAISGKARTEDTVTLRFEVSDTGIGIKPEDIEKLVIPYTRVDEERNRGVEGTGLGMSIITNLLHLMGSSLHVDSVYGEGSTFYFEVVQKIVDPEPMGDIEKRFEDMVKDYEYKVSFIAPNARILMVDDNSMNRDIFANLLKKTKIAVETVSSGKKCLELTQTEYYDIIFMDYLMPEMDGYETLCALRAQKDSPCKDTPIIALTANAFHGDRDKYISMGFDDFLAKPIVTEKLEQMIREMLPEEYVEEAKEKIDADAKQEEDIEFPPIEKVNWEFALVHFRDREILLHSLTEFYKNIDAEHRALDELEQTAHDEEGMKNYRIRVHALKSTAAMVGIMSVSEIAKLLEKAARAEDRERITLLHPILMEELSLTKEQMQPFMESEEEEKELMTDREQILSRFGMLRFAMDEMDISNADMVMEQIMKYTYEEALQDRINVVQQKVETLDYEAAAEEIEKIEKLLDG